MRFLDEEHSATFDKICAKMKRSDEYHLAVAYLFSLDRVCREHIEDLFDFSEDVIVREGLKKGWQTGTSMRTTRLAFNLWNGCCSDGETYKDAHGYEDELPSRSYTPDEIFCCGLAPFYFEAIKLRYPMYCGE